MTKLHFDYVMRIDYSLSVSKCYFTIKCIPKNTARQKLLDINISMEPMASYTYSEDGFGNLKIIGAVSELHNFSKLNVSGDVEIGQILYEDVAYPEKTALFKYPYGKTIPGKGLKEYHRLLNIEEFSKKLSDYNKALKIMQRLYKDYTYEIDATNVETTAEEAFELGKGVCQDYAQISISLCRLSGIPARYVTGLMIGEGQSHAWAEILSGDKWIGIDPTNNLLIDDNYIKLCHGRDATDCRINLGIIIGGGVQAQQIEANVTKLIV